ncbi:MAG: phenylalanine--tRNA ligase subunit beta [Acidobacteriota bacterium]
MKFSYNWLREMVEGLDTAPAELERLITIKTAECEGVEAHGDDFVIEVDNKSLTHRPDLWGHHGMAREVAAITGKKLLDPVKTVAFSAKPAPVRIVIDDHALCPRYSALAFENVTVQPSPEWLRARLEAVGLNPINNIVDVTNFVMAELAQPMHAFDADKLHDGPIQVRAAHAGEVIEALNDQSYELDPSNLVIADPQGAIAIAGVIGGAGSAISDATTRLVLESANFNASSIRKTSSKIKLRTDASMRFEKAQDPVNTVRALERAYELLQLVSPGIRLAGGLADSYHAPAQRPPIALPLPWLERKLGRGIPSGEVRAILESLAFRVEAIDEDTFAVFVPSWRATKDVSIKEDLVEEIGRMIGYASITPTAPLTPARVPAASPERGFQHQVREMAVAQGFTEVYNYSFVSEEMAQAFGFDLADHIAVLNPIVADQNLLRTSLLPGIRKNILDNAKNFDQFRLFEIGREIHSGDDGQIPHFAAAVFAKDDGASGLLELKRLAECLLPGATVRPAASTRPFEHPQRACDVIGNGEVAGRLFEFHPRMVEQGRAAVLDLNLKILAELQPAGMRYQPLRRHPASEFDLSVVAGARVLIADVQRAIGELAGKPLLAIAFLRDFALPTGQRSLSYRLTVGAADRTLSTEEVTAVRTAVIEGMRAAGYELRV